jgi:hypothetical protein
MSERAHRSAQLLKKPNQVAVIVRDYEKNGSKPFNSPFQPVWLSLNYLSKNLDGARVHPKLLILAETTFLRFGSTYIL